MSLTNFRNYRDQRAGEDWAKYRGTVIQIGRTPIVLTGIATEQIEPGRVVVASAASQTANNYLAQDYNYMADWSLPAAAITTNKLLGVALKNEREQYSEPIKVTDFSTDTRDDDIIKSGDPFRIVVQGFVWATTKATTVDIESPVYVDYTTVKGAIQVASVTDENTVISDNARIMAYKSKAAGTGVYHAIPLYVDFLNRL